MTDVAITFGMYNVMIKIIQIIYDNNFNLFCINEISEITSIE